jgi:predicted permease
MWLEDVARDVSFWFRTLRRSPGFLIAALLSLALGIGANAGIFSLVDQVLVRSLSGVRNPEQLVLLNWVGRDLATSFGVGPLMSYPLCRELQEQTPVFESAFCRAPTGVNFSSGQQQEPVRAEVVSGSYFSALGVVPAAGRLIERSDDLQAGAHPVVVLSYRFWRNRLGGAQDVVGRRVLVNNYPMTVIGVAPQGFVGVDPLIVPSLWVPATMTELAAPIDANWNRTLDRRTVWMHVFGRLKPGVSADEARAMLQPWFKAMLEADSRSENFPNVPADRRREFLASTLDIQPASQGTSDRRGALERPLLVLMGGTVLLLLLASSNVAGLLLARGAARTRELVTRMALGATHGRLTRQLLLESLLITLGGGVLGLVTAPVVSSVLLSFLGPDTDLRAAVDHRIFLFALIVSIATGALCAVAPAFHTRRLSLNERAQGSLAGVGLRKALVVGQIAFTLILLTGAGLFVQTVNRLKAEAPGGAGRVVMFRADAPSIGYSSARARQFMRELARKLEAVAPVERAAMANTSLLAGGSFSRTLTIESDERIVTDRPVYGLRVTPGFFATLGTRVIAGRDFDERDTRLADDTTTGYRSIIVNESFVKRYLGGRNPVGRRVGFGNRADTPTDVEVIGVIEDLSYISLRSTEREHIFLPFWELGSEDGTVYLRVRGDPESAFAQVRAAVADLDATLPLDTLRTFGDQIDRSLVSERMLATLTGGFGLLALLLSAVGLYGVMSLVATRRTQEIGLRIALGAGQSAAVWIVVREALVMVGAGIVCAIPIAWAFRRIVQTQLFGVGVFDAPAVALAGSGLGVVALGAAVLPAWRAALVPPMVAIRDQPESLWQGARSKVHHALRELVAGGERAAAPSVNLIREFTGLVQRAESFHEALAVALPALGERVGADSVVLLEKVSRDEYRSETCRIPARGLLINRLTHYPHPLPLTQGDIDAWLVWAREFRPDHVGEIEELKNARARMAVALRTKREIVGVLLLGTPEGHEMFTNAQKQVLSSAADVFALMIENARLNDRAIEQEKVRRDLALAAEVQKRLLPPQPPSSSIATWAAFTLPARTVGGDYYDFVELPGDRIGMAIADIAGKGIAAALLMSVVQASLRVIWTESDVAPNAVAAKMNRFLQQSTASNGYATFFYALVDAERSCLRYVNAGHNPPYLVRRTSGGVQITDLSVGGTVLGLFPTVEYEDAEVGLCPGDLLVAFTDGVTEARRASGEEFGEERLKALLHRAVGSSADEVSSMLADEIREWISGAEQHDDLTFVVTVIGPAFRNPPSA